MRARVWKLLCSVFIVVFALSIANAVYAVEVTATIKVGGAPWGVAYDSGKSEVFVVNSASNNVLVISDSTNAVVATVPVGSSPYRAVYDSAKSEIFVANYGANTVSVISDSANAVVATVPVGIHPASFTYDSVKGEVFVANSGAGTVSVISDNTNAVVATLTVGLGPYDLAYDSVKGEVFVANSGARSVSIISDSTNTIGATVSVGSGPLGVAYDSGMGEIFVLNSVTGTASVISDSTNTVIATVAVGTNPGPIAYDSGKGQIFAVNKNDSSVSVISDSTNAVVATLTVGNKPYGEVYDSSKGEVFVANYGDGTVSVISDASSTTASTSPTAPGSTTPATSTSPTAMASASPSSPTSTPAQTAAPSTAPVLLQQVWVPKPTNAAVAVGVTAAVVGVISLIFAALSDPLAGAGGKVGDKTSGLIPDNIKQWLEEVVSSRRKAEIGEKKGSPIKPTKMETVAYITSIIVLGFSFAYVKVITLDQLWTLLPVFFITSVLVGFVQKFFSIAYMRSRGIWSEHKIWPLGLILFLFTTFAFKVPFSAPTRSVHQSKEDSERHSAFASTVEILISLAFAGAFFLLVMLGYTAIGGAGLAMCVIGSFFGTFPITPLSGKEIFDHNKRLWAGLFVATLIIFVVWLLLL